ncbi:MAG: putative alpha/beta hydrolase family esterase [Acidimicrobiales bacterium]|jgi:predicted alpha/beta hydrolase family esterase
MKKQVVFIGGGDSYSNYDDYVRALENAPLRNLLGEKTARWTDGLRDDLGDEYELYMIPMPNTDNAQYSEWKIWFEKHFEYLHHGAILVGWSLGGMFLVKYLIEKEAPFPINALFLLAAPCGIYDDGAGNDCGSFQFNPEALSIIPKKVSQISILHSKDDFVVPYEHALEYKEALPGAELVTFEDKNHFLVEELPELVEMIRKL